jgi:hypothetical protein
MKKSVDVYWSPSAFNEELFVQQTLLTKIEPLKTYMQRVRNDENRLPYQSCAAFREYYSNTFVIYQPFSAFARLNDNGQIVETTHPAWFNERVSSIKNAVAINFDLGWLFFTEEEGLKMELTPPFLHKTSLASTGFLAAGCFDISSWFRPAMCTWQLWEGERELNLVEGEAIGYVTFHTDKQVNLKLFKRSEILAKGIYATSGAITALLPLRSLKQRYDMFRQSKTNKVILSEIKKNLVE